MLDIGYHGGHKYVVCERFTDVLSINILPDTYNFTCILHARRKHNLAKPHK